MVNSKKILYLKKNQELKCLNQNNLIQEFEDDDDVKIIPFETVDEEETS